MIGAALPGAEGLSKSFSDVGCPSQWTSCLQHTRGELIGVYRRVMVVASLADGEAHELEPFGELSAGISGERSLESSMEPFAAPAAPPAPTAPPAPPAPSNRAPVPITLVNSGIADVGETRLMQIECGFVRGFAGMQMIGNTSEVCRDGKERARAALESLAIHIPARRLVVSLTPADIKKDGSQFDLPIAVSLALLLTGQTPRINPSRWLFAAELGLCGELRPVRGIVSFFVAAMAAGLEGLVVASENLAELQVLTDLCRSGLPHGSPPPRAQGFPALGAVLQWIFEGQGTGIGMIHKFDFASSGRSGIASSNTSSKTSQRSGTPESPLELRESRIATEPFTPFALGVNFDDMILQPALALTAMVAAAGMHSLLLRGCPGTGKSMLAARLTSILPNLSRSDHIEAMRIYSAAVQRLPSALLAGRPPYRAPHHLASATALLGSPESPGELALAHGGVLFLDELPEFRRDVLEALREPLESGEVNVARSRRKLTWRSRVILIAACNNCPCGWAGSPHRDCICASGRLLGYRQRLSGPLLERVDLHFNVPESVAPIAELFISLGADKEDSQTLRMARKVAAARVAAESRNEKYGVVLNRDLPAVHLVEATGLTPKSFIEIVNTYIPKSASRRVVMRCLRVARTLADLEGSTTLRGEDVAQAWRWQSASAAAERGDDLSGLR